MNNEPVARGILLAFILVVQGCTNQVFDLTRSDIDDTDREATEIRSRIGDRHHTVPVVADEDMVWLGAPEPVPVSRNLPPEITSGKIVISDRSPLSLEDVVSRIRSQTGLPIRIDPDVLKTSAGTSSGGETVSQIEGAVPGAVNGGGESGAPSLGSVLPLGFETSSGNLNEVARIRYSGKIEGLLDTLSNLFDVSWEWDGKRIRIYRFETRVFTLETPQLRYNVTAEVGGSASGADTGSSTSSSTSGTTAKQKVSAVANIEMFDAIHKSVKAMLTDAGKIEAHPELGHLIVTERPMVLDRISEYVDSVNAKLSRKVAIEVRALAVDLSTRDTQGIDWQAVWNAAGVKLTSASVATTGTLAGMTFSVVKPQAPWDGTNVIVKAIARQNDTRAITSASLVTANGYPAPLRIGRDVSYVANVSTTATGGTGSSSTTTSIEQGTVSTGFNMQVIPRIQDDGEILLSLNLEMSSLLGLDTFSSGGQQVQTPRIDKRAFMQTIPVHDGEVVILSGYQNEASSNDTQGPGSPRYWFAGGNRTADRGRAQVVLILSPRILDI